MLTVTSIIAGHAITLPPVYRGQTWQGLRWRAAAPHPDFAHPLTAAAFQLQTESGTAALTLASATGAVIIDNATPNEWQATVQPLAITVPAGNYAWALETTDAVNRNNPRCHGVISIIPL
jgi:CelD/BcsL family acetyltransferase involved in cellulose biosynthesis